MKRSKANGITLIALVITIIVLLILAGVAISTLTGDNRILTKAVLAKDATRGGEVKDYVRMAVAENAMADNTNGTRRTRAEVISELSTQGKLTPEEVAKLTDEENPVDVITIGGIEINFGELGGAGKTLVEAFKAGEIKVGDYINYTPSDTTAQTDVNKQETGVDGTQTYTVDTSMSWRVLGLNKNETELLIISESPIKRDGTDPYLSLQGVESYYNCVSTLNKICKIYDNSSLASETRSMKIEDINNALGIEQKGNGVYKKTDTSQTTNLDQLGVLGNSYTYKGGEYAPRKYMKDIYGVTLKEGEEETIGKEEPATVYYYSYTDESIVDPNSPLYELLFSGTTDSDNYAKSYWLASPAVGARPDIACFGPGFVGCGIAGTEGGLFYSYGSWSCFRFGVRPLVSLRSNITINQLTTSSNGVKADWSGVTLNPNVNSGYLTGEEGKVASESH